MNFVNNSPRVFGPEEVDEELGCLEGVAGDFEFLRDVSFIEAQVRKCDGQILDVGDAQVVGEIVDHIRVRLH